MTCPASQYLGAQANVDAKLRNFSDLFLFAITSDFEFMRGLKDMQRWYAPSLSPHASQRTSSRLKAESDRPASRRRRTCRPTCCLWACDGASGEMGGVGGVERFCPTTEALLGDSLELTSSGVYVYLASSRRCLFFSFPLDLGSGALFEFITL